MTEYIERNKVRDAVASLATMRFELSNAYRVYIEALKNVDAEVMKIPAADVVEVVRCRDCYYSEEDKLFGGWWCKGRKINPDGFCSDGVKRGEL